MPEFLPRFIASKFQYACEFMPVVVLTGARQTGKSTFVRNTAAGEGRIYKSLDNRNAREQAQVDPENFLGTTDRLTIDEVQRVPELLSAIKIIVDDEHQRHPGHFVLTGSANLLLMRRVNESLAGRALYLKLWPLTRREQLGLGTVGIWSQLLATSWKQWSALLQDQSVYAEDWRLLAQRGGYPQPATYITDPQTRSAWFDGYIDTYLERDITDLAAIGNLVDFRRIMRMTALQVGNIINQSEIARRAEVPQSTTGRYLSLLETSYQLVRLPAYAVSRRLRLIRSPKVYWSDVGLALALSGDQPSGAHLENIVFNDLLAWRSAEPSSTEIMYWHTETDREVDFVIETPKGLLAIEVKSREQPRTTDAGGIREFLDEYGDQAIGGLILHGGTETWRVAERVVATPWWRVI